MADVGASAQPSDAAVKITKPQHKNILRTNAVTESARGQNERRENDGVGAYDPLQLGHASPSELPMLFRAVFTMVTSS